MAWIYGNDIKEYKMIGIYHDNPLITPLSECYYVASIWVKKEIKDTSLPVFTIPSGVYAKFDISGKYGDILRFLEWVYHSWLPSSGYETTTLPSYTIFKKNHFLSKDRTFEAEFYLPIRVV